MALNIHKWIYNLKVSVFVRNTNHENMLSSNSNKKNLLSLRLLYFLISIAIILISLYRLRFSWIYMNWTVLYSIFIFSSYLYRKMLILQKISRWNSSNRSRNYSKYDSNRWFVPIKIYIFLKFLEKSKENYKKYWISKFSNFRFSMFSLLLLISVIRASVILFIYLNNSRSW